MMGKTVDGIMKTFTKTITDLQVVAEREQGKASVAEDAAAKMAMEAVAHRNEGVRAGKLARKLEDFVSVP